MTNHRVDSLTDSIYVPFDEEAWGRLRAETPLPLSEEELERLRGINEQVSLEEVAQIYLPMSRLLNLYVGATQDLYRASSTFLGGLTAKVPYIIGIGGSVAVGKSTTGRILRELLARWPNHPQVDLVTTDGFLHPNAVLEERDLMERKGFPESFDLRTLVNFVLQVKSGERKVEHPVYSHHSYDIRPGVTEVVDQPDILILEGLNVLQARSQSPSRNSRLMLSDLFRLLDLRGRRDGGHRALVRRALPDLSRHRVPGSGRLLPPLCEPEREGRGRHRPGHLEEDQRTEPDPEHHADPRARGSDPGEGAGPRRAADPLAQALASGHTPGAPASPPASGAKRRLLDSCRADSYRDGSQLGSRSAPVSSRSSSSRPDSRSKSALSSSTSRAQSSRGFRAAEAAATRSRVSTLPAP